LPVVEGVDFGGEGAGFNAGEGFGALEHFGVESVNQMQNKRFRTKVKQLLQTCKTFLQTSGQF
jgi:hypothetical protein